MTQERKDKYFEFLTDTVSGFSYYDIDGFEDFEEMTEEEIEELLSIPIRVVLDERNDPDPEKEDLNGTS
jgi:hypothetical protein